MLVLLACGTPAHARGKAHAPPSCAPIYEAGLLGVLPLPADEVIRTGMSRTYERNTDQIWEAALQLTRQAGVPLYLDPAGRVMTFLKQEYIPEWKSDLSTVPSIYVYTLVVEPVDPGRVRVHIARGCVAPDGGSARRSRKKPNPYQELALGSGDRQDADYYEKRMPARTDSLVILGKQREESFRGNFLDRLSVQLLSGSRWPWLSGDPQGP